MKNWHLNLIVIGISITIATLLSIVAIAIFGQHLALLVKYLALP